MSQDDTVYDLGDVEHDAPRPYFEPVFARKTRPTPVPPPRQASAATASGVGPALAGSLSMFVPGLGQMIAGEVAWGLFYLSGVGFCAATLRAALVTLDRLVPTLGVLEVPLPALIVTLGALTAGVMVLHLAAVLHAHALAASSGESAAPHPIVAALASLLVPGWGQLLAGHRRRAGLFLGGVWLLGAAWVLVTPKGSHLLARLGLSLPAALRDGWGPVVMLSAPLILWAIAVYDAAAGAAAERRA